MNSLSTRPRRLIFVCTTCAAEAPKWQGRCDACGSWNSLAETASSTARREHSPASLRVPAIALDRVGDGSSRRLSSGTDEVDRVLGGGVVAGSLILLGGDPGIGKSTLALQIAAAMGSPEQPVLYCAGEESAAQVAMRAQRLGCRSAAVAVLAETDLDAVIEAIETDRPPLAVVDSVQTLSAPDAGGVPGSPGQVREAVARLLTVAKRTAVPILLVGHVTKEGAIAGPRTLEHMVDVVLYLEGERHGDHRLLRGVKNRFGSTGELGIFTMEGGGLAEVEAPGRAFLEESSLAIPGNVLTVTCEGTRPMVVEIQALVASTSFAVPRRQASGFDLGRLHLLLAVLERRAEISLGGSDVYVNVVGGIRVSDPAADLAVALAVAGAAANRQLIPQAVVLGELGLGGEVRRVSRLEQRLGEAATIGQQTAIVPAAGTVRAPGNMRVARCAALADATGFLLHR